MNLTKGQSAPDFQALDQSGQKHQLQDYTGRWLLLYFYPEDDTPGCTTEACNFRDAKVNLPAQVAIVGVSANTADDHQHFANKYHLNFPLLADPEKIIIKAYGADGFIFNKRVSFLIDPTGKIAKIYSQVNPDHHSDEVRADLAHFLPTT